MPPTLLPNHEPTFRIDSTQEAAFIIHGSRISGMDAEHCIEHRILREVSTDMLPDLIKIKKKLTIYFS